MAAHSSNIAWEIPWTEERGGLQFMGSREPDTSLGLNSTSTANTKNHKLSGFNNQNPFSQRYRGWKSKLRVSAGPVPSNGWEGERDQASLQLLGVVGNLWVSLSAETSL